MDQSAAAGLAGLNVNYYARYQVPKSARIPRKPVSPSLYAASITLNDETNDELTEARNPLAKIINILPQSTSGGGLCTQSTVTGDGASPIIHTRILRPESCGANIGSRFALLQKLFDLWTKEAVCLLISLGCIVIIVAVLQAVDGASLSRPPLAVTLNVFLAFFTTFAVVALYIPVTETISQWKWNWFISKHPLADYEIIDGASRSAWGAVLLLRHFSPRHVICLGAMVQILSVFIAPITQMMISYPQHLVTSSGEQAVVRTTQVLQDAQRNPFEPCDLQAAVAAGLVHSLESIIQPVAPSCTTADCTFDTFESLAVCAKVNDITHLLDITAQNGTSETGELSSYVASLPPTANCKLESPKPHAVISCKTLEEATLSFDGAALSRVAIYSMPVIYVDSQNPTGQRNTTTSGLPNFGAFEVLFHFCVNSYDIRMLAGTVTTKTTEHQPVAPEQETGHLGVNCSMPSAEIAKTGCSWDTSNTPKAYLELLAPGGSLQVLPNGTASFRAEIWTVRTLISAMHGLMSGLWEWDGGNYNDGSGALSVHITGATGVQAIAAAIQGPEATDASSRLPRLSNLAQNVAIALTNGIRLKKQQTTAEGTDVNAREIKGKTLKMETSISIKWGWLTLFILQYLLAVGFFVSTVILTDRSGGQVVKSSTLATMVALGEECGPELGGIDSLTTMRKRAKDMQVQRDGAYLELAGPASGPKTAHSSNSHVEEKTDVTVTESKV